MTLKAYKRISLCLAMSFGIVGLIFLFMSSDVLLAFNRISRTVGMEEGVSVERNFYVILAVAYMYLVTMLASMMYVNPERLVYPLLLINGKIASSAVSMLFFFIDKHLLIYMTNGVVDGLIGVLVIAMYRNIRRSVQ